MRVIAVPASSRETASGNLLARTNCCPGHRGPGNDPTRPGPRHLALGHLPPERRIETAKDRGQKLLLAGAIVGEQDVGQEGPAIAQQQGRQTGGVPRLVEPAADYPGVLARRLGRGDVP